MDLCLLRKEYTIIIIYGTSVRGRNLGRWYGKFQNLWSCIIKQIFLKIAVTVHKLGNAWSSYYTKMIILSLLLSYSKYVDFSPVFTIHSSAKHIQREAFGCNTDNSHIFQKHSCSSQWQGATTCAYRCVSQRRVQDWDKCWWEEIREAGKRCNRCILCPLILHLLSQHDKTHELFLVNGQVYLRW